MLYEVRLRVKTMWLGQNRTPDGFRRFEKTKDGDIAVKIPRWLWALNNVLPSLADGKNISTATILLPPHIGRPALFLYEHKNAGFFEAINPGAPIDFQVMVTQDLPPGHHEETKRPPTKEELQALFQMAGERIGFSPYRPEMGWGRCRVERVTVV